MVDAVRAFDARGLATYPDYRAAVIETAAFLGVDPEWLVLTNGLDEGVLLDRDRLSRRRTPAALVEAGAVRRAERPARSRDGAARRSKPTSPPPKALGARIVGGAAGAGLRVPGRRHAGGDHAATRGWSTSTTRTTRPASRLPKDAIRA